MLKHNKPHKCDVPGCHRLQGFTTINDLNRHKKSVHKIGVTCISRAFKCASEGCKSDAKIWPRLDNFKQHVLRMHKDADVDDLVTRSEVKSGESNEVEKQGAEASTPLQHRNNVPLSAMVTLPTLKELLQEHGLQPMLCSRSISNPPQAYDSETSSTMNGDQKMTSAMPMVRSASPTQPISQAHIPGHGTCFNNLPPINNNQPWGLPRDETTNRREGRFHCMHGQCGAKFQRKFDLQRHIACIHVKNDANKYDCPLKTCHRKGAKGFTRRDHRTEHLREYHHRNISKRIRKKTDKEDEATTK